LVGLSLTATLPSIENYVKIIGFVGVAILLVVYILTGTFTFVLDDAVQKADILIEKQHQEMVQAARNPNISFPRTITTRPETRFDGP
jgi:hypothetical protein